MKNKFFVYHRAINSEASFSKFLDIAKSSKYSVVAEGDLCWSDMQNDILIYIHHPDLSGKSISKKRLQSDCKILELEKILQIDSSANFILELKDGNSDIDSFLYKLKSLLESYKANNILIDAFSVDYLKKVKEIIPDIKISLHTKLVFGRYILETSYKKPYIKIHNIYNLPFVDFVTISYATTHVNFFGLDIDKSYRHIYLSGKKLNLGAIKTIKAFNRAIDSGTCYLYLRSRIVKQYFSYI
jgi:hypothetical protein